MASEGLHESADKLKPETQDMHRAIVSLMEELEAVDWYGQRVDAASDGELRAILAHNREEEQEHAAMVLEWIRRHDPGFDRHLRTYLFTSGSITGREGATVGREAATVSRGTAAPGRATASREAGATGREAGGNGNINGDRPTKSVGSLRESR